MRPRFKPRIGRRELAAALSVRRGDDVARFEQAFSALLEQRFAVAFPYGRTGLLVLLEALGLQGKQVICPTYTCVVVAHAIVRSGNTPVFVDCKPGDFNMDLDAAEKRIGPQTGALIATSIFGHPVNLDRLDEIRSSHPQVFIIEDCAHSFAAAWRGRPVQKAGAAAIFGLNVSKTITSVFGGMVTTDSPVLAERLRTLRAQKVTAPGMGKSLRRLFYLFAVYFAFKESVYGLVSLLQRVGLLDRFVRYYDAAEIDMPEDHLVGMTALEARVGLEQVARYPDIIRSRREQAAMWRSRLKDSIGVELPPDVPGSTYSHFACLVEDPGDWIHRWRKRGVELGRIIDYSIADMEAYRCYADEDLPVARHYARHVVNFPVS